MTAAVVTQVKNFNDTQSGSGSGTFVHAGPGGLYDTFNPFNSSLGTLNSFTIAWVIDLTSDGTTDAGGGSILIQIAKAGLVRRTFQSPAEGWLLQVRLRIAFVFPQATSHQLSLYPIGRVARIANVFAWAKAIR